MDNTGWWRSSEPRFPSQRVRVRSVTAPVSAAPPQTSALAILLPVLVVRRLRRSARRDWIPFAVQQRPTPEARKKPGWCGPVRRSPGRPGLGPHWCELRSRPAGSRADLAKGWCKTHVLNLAYGGPEFRWKVLG